MAIDAVGDYANKYIRPPADMLAKEYNQGVALLTQWNSLGGGATATQVMASAIQAYAMTMACNQYLLMGFEMWWDGLGAGLVPNNATVLNDGSGADGRQTITGAKATTLITNIRSRCNWLAAGTATWPSTTPLSTGGANLNTVIGCANSPIAANCGNVINRITELKTQYEASTNAVINAIQQVGVNVR